MGGHIPDPRAAAGWSSVSTHTKRQVTLLLLMKAAGGGTKGWLGLGGMVRSGTVAGNGNDLDNGNVLFTMTPAKVMVQRNADSTALTV